MNNSHEKTVDNKAVEYLLKIQEYIGGEFKISKRKVPHLVINNWYSICYFAKNDFFRVFLGYGTIHDKKYKNFSIWEEVVSHFHYDLGFIWIGDKTIRNYSIPLQRWDLLDFDD